ncbi:uncharacterized protein LACBIDRAFT_330999 [Laccaria bicolor S238N-H82]|uniref:Predicted protein n=1 Tax=Laccaria bicolor (strain S238N-H82 / ATCC MYA-4686) TaxID=486041 RepID=B0DMY1_LACBS|nr:uncharacterized protein LACBIDRAFT_330999 [Laccaria bicolor S238N-H82]EDR04128.1 predicted protein [Laccaria bicolor S238N-H82]|eukprot:XP_001885383.1 predicted protein [Laccaria bicolor S238N-H82]
MYYQQEHQSGGAYTQAFKHTHLDSDSTGHPHGPGNLNRGFGSLRPCGMMILNTSGQSTDLSQMLLSLANRAEKAETQLAELAAKHAADYLLLLDKISELENKVVSPILNGAGGPGTTTAKKPQHGSNDDMALEFPMPLEPGMPAWMSAEGYNLWNPYWCKETMDAEDAKNAKFINTIVSSLVANSKKSIPGAVSIIPTTSLEPPYEAVFNAVKGHFTYLCGKYQETVDPVAKQYFTVPHPFLLESTGIGPESVGIHFSYTDIH